MRSHAQDAWNHRMPVSVGSVTTAFERQAAKLGLAGLDEWRQSERLRAWVKKNCTMRYVPEELLLAFGLNPWECANLLPVGAMHAASEDNDDGQ